MKGIYTLLFSLIVLVMFSACNDEWKEEQFEHYISFKAPINSNGVTRKLTCLIAKREKQPIDCLSLSADRLKTIAI